MFNTGNTNMDFNKEDVLRLIEAYREQTILWDPKDKWHFNRNKKADAWEEIGKAVEIDAEEAKKKISSLLGSFRREKAKGKKSIGTGKGADEVYKSEWFAFKSFAFLMDKDNPRESLNSEEMNIETGTFPDPVTIQEESYSSTDEQRLENEPINKSSQQGNEETPNFVKPTKSQKRKRVLKINHENEDPRIQQAFEFIRQPSEIETTASLYGKYLVKKLDQFDKQTQSILTHKINQLIFETEMQIMYSNNSRLTTVDNSAPCSLSPSLSSSISSPSEPPISFHSQPLTPVPIEPQETDLVSELQQFIHL